MVSAPVAIAIYKKKKSEEIKETKRKRYEIDPVAWIQEQAQGFMYNKLKQIAGSVAINRRTAVPSCHEAGKSWIAARIAAWWIAAHPPGQAFVVTTAPTNRQVKAVLWKEIRRVYKTAKLDGRMNQTEWWINSEMIAMGLKPSDYDPTAFQGIHAKYVLVIVDEACGVPQNIYLAANSLMANEFGRILAIGNPDDPDSYFAQICAPDSGWNVIPISAFDTPNFTGEDAPQEVKDVLVGPIYVDEMKRDVGEDSAVYVSKVLGQFPQNNVDGVILLSWLRRCQEERDEYDEDNLLPVELGIDVGAGGDETSIRERRGILAGRMWEKKTPEPENALDIVVEAIETCRPTRIKIDSIGIGWGLIGLIKSLILRGKHENELLGREIDISFLSVDNVIGVNVGQASTDLERFPRLRDQLWWEVGRGLSIDRVWDLSLIDDLTISQLIAPTWKPDLAGRHKVESKLDTMKRTKKPSPNRADALLLAFCNPPMEDIEQVIVYHDPVVIGAQL